MRLSLNVNGEQREADGVWEGESLLYVLRERLGFPGSKNACEQGECGSCSVYLDGVLVCSCLVLAGQAEDRDVVTVDRKSKRLNSIYANISYADFSLKKKTTLRISMLGRVRP